MVKRRNAILEQAMEEVGGIAVESGNRPKRSSVAGEIPRTKYAKVGKDEPLRVILDIGNENLKAMMHGCFGEEVIYPQMQLDLHESEWEQRVEQSKGKSQTFGGTAVYKYMDKGRLFGVEATTYPGAIRYHGTDKYEADRIGSAMVSALLHLYPESHNNVRVVIMHPADVGKEDMQRLAASLKGEKVVQLLNGRTVKYKITGMTPLVEPIAAAQTFMLNTRGEPYIRGAFKLLPGMRLLLVDIGGGLTSLGLVELDASNHFQIASKFTTLDIGIQQVFDFMQAELRGLPEFRGMQTIGRHILSEALKTGEISLPRKDDKGRQIKLNVIPIVERAISVLANPVRQTYRRTFNGGIGISAIEMSGGGGGDCHPYFTAQVFGHDDVYTAEEVDSRQVFGAIRGASKGLINALIMRGE